MAVSFYGCACGAPRMKSVPSRFSRGTPAGRFTSTKSDHSLCSSDAVERLTSHAEHAAANEMTMVPAGYVHHVQGRRRAEQSVGGKCWWDSLRFREARHHHQEALRLLLAPRRLRALV